MNEDAPIVWLADRQAAQHFDFAQANAADAARYQRMRAPRRRLQWQISRALLAHAGVARAAQSISHSGDFAALVRDAQAAAVGVDLELIKPRDFMRLAGAAFATVEYEQLRELHSTEPAAVPLYFYQLWTLKESFAKALPMPLAAALRECVFERQLAGWRATIPTPGPWHARVWQPRTALVLAAVAVGPQLVAGPHAWTVRCWPTPADAPWPVKLDLSTDNTGWCA